ncbi:uncharacterized protein LOC126746453 [Anthonomus grandis grandis]|uniref:uncharacterized protein LOC126746453 n=1 Tax=Anthonomus grandis grandis TaxID=2921223 RepID=UPI0021650D1C|nr:uncharacterized protein LOC126746453 [Anthonomus grandis grandis]
MFDLVRFGGVATTVVFTQFLKGYAYSLQSTDSESLQTSAVTETTGHDNYEKYYVEYTDSYDTDQSVPSTWSVVWYIASFTGLILFFLIVSCSEWCCRRNARRNCQRTTLPQGGTSSQRINDTPPPPYDNFAPPKYEEVLGMCSSGEKSKYDVFVVSEHTLGTIMKEASREDDPPSYHCASVQLARLSELPRVHHGPISGASRVT